MNRYSPWKYILILFLIGLGALYALPNLYDKDPALQITASTSAEISELTEFQVGNALDEANIAYESMQVGNEKLVVRFENEDIQLRAKSIVEKSLGRNYIVALNLVPATPMWLRDFGAEPMFLGLDLRGGVHFLMEVDMDAAIVKAENSYMSDLRSQMRENKIRYKTITSNKPTIEGQSGGILIRFKDDKQRDSGEELIDNNFPDLAVTIPNSSTNESQLVASIKEQVILDTKKLALQQNITILRKRVNEIGVAEPVIQQQGLERIVVQLPGVQDQVKRKRS